MKPVQRLAAAVCSMLLFVSFGIHSVSSALAAQIEPGVSREFATSRAARLTDLHYALEFQLAPHALTIEGRETLTFVDSGTGDLALDYRDGTISAASLNGKDIPTDLKSGHLELRGTVLVKGKNELKLSFASHVATAGKAITRYEDRDDQSEYIYTLFVPMDASMAFPCFDQPDLKGRFSLTITAPAQWTVVSNTAAAVSPNGTTSVSIFPETQPISTYLFAFAAGPFESLPGTAPGLPALYVRKSQLARARAEAPQVQQIAARGIKYFADYFAQPFPFTKYDLVLIPGFPFGGMEHAGATFLNEDSVLFRTAPTESDYFRRNILVLHETCHQWFGDLVTMRWFDDLWLKEGFAQYMAYEALTELDPAQKPWKHFYEEIRPLAYGIDETRGTTPIFQNIVNLKDAKSAYGAIVYQKAPAVLKQLNFFLGIESFRDGMRFYLNEHAYANAQWADLIQAFETASNQRGLPRDVKAWARAWILQPGMPEVKVDHTCNAGKITSLTLSQKDVLQRGSIWPLSNEVLLISAIQAQNTSQSAYTDVQTLKVSWNAATFPVSEAIGKPCPALVFANEDDYGYGRFLLDPDSARVAASLLNPEYLGGPNPGLVDSVSDKANTLRRSMLWGALWDNVHVAQAPPRGYVELVLKALPVETDESLARIQGGRVGTVLHAYMTEKGRAAFAPLIESVTADRMLHAPTLGLRIVNFRTFTGIAETPRAHSQLKALLDGSLVIPGMPLKPLDRWNLIGHLIAMNDSHAAALFAAERAKDQSGEGQKYAYAVEAGTPSAAIKARYFDEYLHSPDRQEDWITQSLRPFNSWNQASLTEPYLTRALDALAAIKQHRKIFFLGAWLGAFIDGQQSPQAQAVIHAWLDRVQDGPGKLDPDLRLKVLEVSDGLDRTVMIRQKFPE